MPTRRTVIKTLAAMPSVFSLSPAWADGDTSRLTLVIGNSAYRNSPLLSPGNDARAMAGPKLSAQLKCEVVSRGRDGRYFITRRTELVSMRQRAVSA